MTLPIRVVGFAGSLRKQSYNRALLRTALEVLPEGMELEIVELDELPLFSEDREHPPPEAVRIFCQAIRQADALLIATPEYNYSFSGVLKNAIDWASRPPGQGAMQGKPTAIMGCSPGRFGTVRAQLALRQTLLYLNMPAVMHPEVMVTNAAERFDDEGQLSDERTRKQVTELLGALKELVDITRKSAKGELAPMI
jgi:chromate reductase, NAD(P)H dehydrogenase (quinone)